eukprot:2942918-Amphidinium_carterae.1
MVFSARGFPNLRVGLATVFETFGGLVVGLELLPLLMCSQKVAVVPEAALDDDQSIAFHVVNKSFAKDSAHTLKINWMRACQNMGWLMCTRWYQPCSMQWHKYPNRIPVVQVWMP